MATLQKWHGHNFYSNLSETEFYSFRETGYAGDVVKALDKTYPELYLQYDILVYFQLAHDQQVWHTGTFEKPLILFVIAHENPALPIDLIQKTAIIFKQYLDVSLSRKYKTLYQLPVGPSSQFPVMPVVPFSSRPHNVFFSGNLHRGRQQLYKELTGVSFLPFSILHRFRKWIGTNFSSVVPQSTITFSKSFHSGFSPQVYAQHLSNSKIVLCPYGVSEKETMRHFEAMKQGCVVVTDVMPETYYFKNAPFVVLPAWRGLKETLKKLVTNPDLLLQTHVDMLNWWQNVCSISAVVQYIHQMVQRNAVKPKL